MTVVPPSVSTSVSDFTTALASARCCAPDDSIVCTNVGRPIGIAEIAVEMHSSTSVSVSWPRAMPTMAMIGDRRPGEEPEDLRQAVELALQRRLRALRRRDHVGDVAHLGRLTGVASRRSVAVPRVTWVFWNTMFVRSPSAVSPVGERRGVLGDRRALAGERRLLHLERRRRDDAAVGRHDVAGLEQHDVARHEPGRRRPPRRARRGAPGRAAPAAGPAPRRWPAPCSSWLVPMTTLNVTSSATKMPGRDLADREAGDRDDQQHDVHRVRQLARARPPTALGGGSVGELVRPVLGEPPLRPRRRRGPARDRPPAGRRRPSADSAYHAGVSELCSIVLMPAPAHENHVLTVITVAGAPQRRCGPRQRRAPRRLGWSAAQSRQVLVVSQTSGSRSRPRTPPATCSWMVVTSNPGASR